MKIIRKRIKNIYIRVEENGTVKVSAPLHTPDSVIEKLIEKNREKLEKIVAEKKENLIDYSKADIIPFLGGFVPIKKAKSNKTRFEFKGGKLFLHLKEGTGKEIENLIFKWYFIEAERIITKFIKKYSPLIPKKISKIRIKKMRTRWGSCNSAKGYLNFNVKLVQKPLKGIEYVVVHELTHLIHANHGKEFYNTLEGFLPDWKEAKKTLLR